MQSDAWRMSRNSLCECVTRSEPMRSSSLWSATSPSPNPTCSSPSAATPPSRGSRVAVVTGSFGIPHRALKSRPDRRPALAPRRGSRVDMLRPNHCRWPVTVPTWSRRRCGGRGWPPARPSTRPPRHRCHRPRAGGHPRRAVSPAPRLSPRAPRTGTAWSRSPHQPRAPRVRSTTTAVRAHRDEASSGRIHRQAACGEDQRSLWRGAAHQCPHAEPSAQDGLHVGHCGQS